MYRKIVYYTLVIIIVWAVNSDKLEGLLDTLVGIQWSGPVISLLRNNTQGFLIILLLSIYIEYVGGWNNRQYFKKLNGKIDSLIDKSELVNVGKREDLTTIVKRYYSTNDVAGLTNIIFDKKESYSNVSVLYRLRNSDVGEDYYSLRYEIEFNSNIKEFVFAFVHSASLQDSLSAESDKIGDIFVLSSPDSFKEEIERIIEYDAFNFNGLVKSNNGGDYVKGVVEKVNKNDYHKYIPNHYHDYDVELFRVDTSAMTAARFCYSFECTMSKSEHYLYWNADRPMLIDSIKVDATGFSFDSRKDFILNPCLVNGKQRVIDQDRDIYTIRVNDWVVRGQGLVFSWH